MKTINHEYYVSYEIAKLLKEAGFDWEVMSFYTNDITEGCESEYELRLVKFDNWNGKNKAWCDLVSAPTLDVAQRWLREVKGVYLDVDTHFNASGVWFSYVINIFDSDAKFGIHSNCLGAGCPFNTYEEAQEAGINKTLEIILEKVE